MFSLPYTRARAALREADASDERRYQRDLKAAQQLRQHAAKLNNIGINSGSDLLLSKTRQLKLSAPRNWKMRQSPRTSNDRRDDQACQSRNARKVLVTLDECHGRDTGWPVAVQDRHAVHRQGRSDRAAGAERRPARPGWWRCCARPSKIRTPREPASRPRSRWCSALLRSGARAVLPTPTRRCARSSAASMSAISVRARCSRGPASRSRCRTVQVSAAVPADRTFASRHVVACGWPSRTFYLLDAAGPTIGYRGAAKRWRSELMDHQAGIPHDWKCENRS